MYEAPHKKHMKLATHTTATTDGHQTNNTVQIGSTNTRQTDIQCSNNSEPTITFTCHEAVKYDTNLKLESDDEKCEINGFESLI